MNAKANATSSVLANGQTMFVQFGSRGLKFSVGHEEVQHLNGHALVLSQSICALQRVVAKYGPDEFGEDIGRPLVGLEFLSGLVSEMLDVHVGGEA